MPQPEIDPRAVLDDGPLVPNADTKFYDLGKANYHEDNDDKDDDDDDDKDKDKDKDEKMSKMKGMHSYKSLPNEDDLVKALGALDATGAAAASGTSIRQTQLAAKMASGEKLTKSESDEMRSSLDESAEDLNKSSMEEFREDATSEEGFEVSKFLEAFGLTMAKSIDGLRGEIRSGRAEGDAFNGVLSKGLVEMGRTLHTQALQISELESMVKSLTGAALMRPQGSRAQTKPSRVGQSAGEGSAAAAGGGPVQLTKAHILESLDTLTKATEGTDHFGVVEGVDVMHETAKYESTGMLGPAAMKLVLKDRNIDPASLSL